LTPAGKNPPEVTFLFGLRKTMFRTSPGVRLKAMLLLSVGTRLALPLE